MKNTLGSFCLLLLLCSSLRAQHAPWEKTAGPPGLTVKVIYKANNIVYAGTDTQGIYKSTDDGQNWTAAHNGIERASIHDIIASGSNLLAAASSTCSTFNNVFKSTDNGQTWSGTSGLSGMIINSFAIKGTAVYAAFGALPGNSGIARSTDDGNTWQIVPSPIANAGETIVSDNGIIVAEDNFIWRSTDDGLSWDVVEQFALTGIRSFARAGAKLFGAANTGIQTSTDNGGSWTFNPFSDGAFSFSSDGNVIYLGSQDKVFKSTDLGTTWNDVSTGLGKGGIQALLFEGTNLFAGTPADAAGVYTSTNGGASWAPAADGLPGAKTIRSLVSFGTDVFAGTEGDGIYRSSDDGDSWVKTDANNALLAQELVLTLCTTNKALFAGGVNGIHKSTDGGATFQRTLNGFPPNIGVFVWSLTVSGGNIVAAVTVLFSPSEALDGIFYSPDNGGIWHQATLPIKPTAVTTVASDGSSLAYAGVFGQSSSVKGLYKSTDAGITWSQRPALNVDIERLAANGSNVLAGGLFAAYYSTDFGESWTFSAPPGNCPFGCGIFTYTFRGSSIFAGDEEGMFFSTDSGATWVPVNEGFPQCPIPPVETSCADDDYLFAGGLGAGVWRKLLGPTPTPTPGNVLYDQYDNFATEEPINIPSLDAEPALDAFDSQAADDFIVPAGQTWQITEVDVLAEYDASGPASSFHVFFYENGAGDLPGELVASRLENPYTGSNNFVITLTSPVMLTEGHYWVSVQARQDITQAGFWLWHNRTVQSNAGAAWQNPGNGFGTGCVSWIRKVDCETLGEIAPDQVFRLIGTSGGGTPTPTPTATPTLTPTPTPTSTVTSTPTPTASPTPRPSVTPRPGPSPRPRPTPLPRPTPP